MVLSLRLAAALLLAALLVSPSALAQAPSAQTPAKSLPPRAAPAASPDGCALGTASADLDVGGVRARLYNTGGLFWRGGDPVYEVPKDSSIHALFAAGIWLGGTVNDTLRFAGANYSNWEWWPGPLDAEGNAPAECAPFDRIWLVTQQPDGSLTGDVADWPADLGAPFEDADGDGAYEPDAGETPTIYGHQTAFWVMNDRGGEHTWSGAEPLGLTARVTAHTYNSDDPALGFGTFYRYAFENPNAYPIENVRLGFWTDPDLGDFNDDYVGSDSTRGMGFVYNGDNDDTGGCGAQPPALGIDFLSGAEGMLYYNGSDGVFGEPTDGRDAYSYLNLTWLDGVPMTVGDNGYNPGSSEETTWMWPGAPETLSFWSEFDINGEGVANVPADRRFLPVAAPFELAPFEAHTVDVALLWGRGVSFLDSVTKLREHSDQVQAAYDAGTLFAPGGAQTGPPDGSAPPLPAPTLAAPTLIFPADGTDLRDVPDAELVEYYDGCLAERPAHACLYAELSWEPVPGAVFYEVQTARDPADFDDDTPGELATTTTFSTDAYTENECAEIYWRVRARTAAELSAYSAPFVYRARYRYRPTFQGEGRGIVEVAYGGAPTCEADPTRPGCAEYGGATIWHTPGTGADYYVTAWGGDGTLPRLEFRMEIAAPFDYEMRFTEACATEGCWGVYTVFAPLREQEQAVRVPFELWQTGIGTPDDPGDDVRMIPVLAPGTVGTDEDGLPIPDTPGAVWPYGTDEGSWDGSGFDGGATPGAPVSDAVYWLMPERPDGYALFAADAAAAGAGNLIADSDTEENESPLDGEPCHFQGFYIDFCHRNDESDLVGGASQFMAPIGRFQLADEAGDGTPPPPGTVIRLLTTKPEPVAAEGDGPLPTTLALDAYPNPARGTATVAYALPKAGEATVVVYDVLGRVVARLAEGAHAAGRHRATLDTRRLASGVYVTVLQTEAGRQTQTLTVLR